MVHISCLSMKVDEWQLNVRAADCDVRDQTNLKLRVSLGFMTVTALKAQDLRSCLTSLKTEKTVVFTRLVQFTFINAQGEMQFLALFKYI